MSSLGALDTSPLISCSPNRRLSQPLWTNFAGVDVQFNTFAPVSHPAVEVHTRPGKIFNGVPRNTANTIAYLVTNSTVFAVTGVFGIMGLVGTRSIVPLTLCSLFNGASVAAFFHLLPDELRKTLAEFAYNTSYILVLGSTQFYLDLVPPQYQILFNLPFNWYLGALLSGTFLSLGSMDKSELSLSRLPPEDDTTLIKTIGFPSRANYTCAKVCFSAMLITAVASTILYSTYLYQFMQTGDIGTIGGYQDMFALFLGLVVGEVAARIGVYYKEKLEIIHKANRDNTSLNRRLQAPRILKVMRVVEPFFVICSPMAYTATLNAPMTPNTPGAFAMTAISATLFKARVLINQSKFEIPPSEEDLQPVPPMSNRARKYCTLFFPACSEKVQNIAWKYFPALGVIAAWTGYMGWALATNPWRVNVAIGIQLTTTYASFIGTDRLAAIYKYSPDTRIANELAFQFLYPQNLAFFYQWLTSKVNIGNLSLASSSNTLSGIMWTAWAFWGTIVGNYLALIAQPKIPYPVPGPPAITLQTLTIPLVTNLES